MGWKNRSKRAVYNTAFGHSSWNRLNFVNFLMYERFASQGGRGRIGMVPDPVPEIPLLDKTDARRRLGIPEDGRIVGFVGMMDHRKAIPELLRAFREAPLGKTDRLLLAGTLDPSFAALIDSSFRDLVRENRLILINRRLGDAELQQGFCSLDVACLPYYEFPGLSSLMLKAVAARRPVLVHDFGWMRAIARRFDVGTRCNIHLQGEFSSAIADALESAPNHGFHAATQALLDYHRPASFVEHSLGTLRELVHRQVQEPPSWESVMDTLDPERRQLY
jgi:glycosyltransferase involved in cell wall biosynthesis